MCVVPVCGGAWGCGPCSAHVVPWLALCERPRRYCKRYCAPSTGYQDGAGSPPHAYGHAPCVSHAQLESCHNAGCNTEEYLCSCAVCESWLVGSGERCRNDKRKVSALSALSRRASPFFFRVPLPDPRRTHARLAPKPSGAAAALRLPLSSLVLLIFSASQRAGAAARGAAGTHAGARAHAHAHAPSTPQVTGHQPRQITHPSDPSMPCSLVPPCFPLASRPPATALVLTLTLSRSHSPQPSSLLPTATALVL